MHSYWLLIKRDPSFLTWYIIANRSTAVFLTRLRTLTEKQTNKQTKTPQPSKGNTVLCIIAQLCLTLQIHQAPLSMGIFQARILEWAAMLSSRESFQPRDGTQVSRIAGEFYTIWATREAMTNLDSTLKSREILLLTKIHIVKAIVFLVAM